MSRVRFAVTGPRSWENEEIVHRALDKVMATYGVGRLLLIAGGAPGVDTIAAKYAKEKGVHVAQVDALWSVYNRRAGPMRNHVMLELEPRFVVAFYWNFKDHRGTTNMVRQTRKAGIPLKLVKVTIDQAIPLKPGDPGVSKKTGRPSRRGLANP